MKLKKIQLRYFPPGLNLQLHQKNTPPSTKQINLYGLTSIQNQHQIPQFINDSILSQQQQYLSQYSAQLTQSIKKIYKKNTQIHSRKFNKQLILKAHRQPLTSCHFSKYGDLFVTSSYDRSCKLWEMDTGMLLGNLMGHQNAVFSVDILENNNKRLIATGSLDKSIKIWSVSGKKFHNLNGHQAEVTKVQFNPNAQHLISSSMDGTVKVWDLQKGTNITTFKTHQNGVITFNHNYQGDQLICCGFDSIPIVIDFKSGQIIRKLQGQHSGEVTCCKFQFTGESCATAGTDKKCIIWDIGMGEAIETLQDHQGQILDLDFNPSGSKLVTASADSSICVYNVNIGVLEHKLKGHQRQVTRVKFNPQGDYILSTGFDGIGRIWRSQTGENVQLLQGHSDEIYSCDISYYGDKIVTCSKDSSCIVWKEKGKQK